MTSAHRNSAHTVARYTGTALMLIGATMFVPLVVLLFRPQEAPLAPCIIFPAVTTMLAGYLICFFLAKDGRALTLSRAEAAGTTLLIWVLAIIAYAVPLVCSGTLDASQAIFESTSGLTTTGLSVVDVASCPMMLLLHRSMMHYVGGVGLILMLACIVSDSHGLKLYSAEGHTERLLARTSSSARMVLVLYTAIIAVGTVAYIVAGMPAFDAVNISISAVSTGGFAVRPDSMASYDSPAIEAITVALMVAGATNFLLNFMLLRGKFRTFLRHAETPMFLAIAAGASVMIAGLLYASGQAGSLLDAARAGVFQAVSVMTSTGLQTVPSFGALAPGILYILMLLMVIGGEAGSTSGGIKVYRLVVYVKSLIWALRDKFGHRRRVYSNKINRFGASIECTPEEIASVRTFVGVYLLLLIACGFIFSLFGASLGDALFESASCLGNTGIGVGFIQAGSPDAVLIVASIAMLFGRLGIFPLIFGLKWMLKSIGEEARHVAHR